ncbi:PREDICTED: exosome complex component RRP40-like [Rhagoletis zephyria]|uniref:exosome complex component RRP40-like n=1 Tax=Rhagoletis zephyria TaxID=28612 RepID=UPI0008115F53|nr:PREDICTED: exosome complex component RRP40-like [Rhagoletis zephyria]
MSSVVENSAILPGENLIELLEACKDNKEKATIVGPGLKRHSKNKINSHAAGQLLHRNGNLFWINSHQRYYIPCERDTVVGVVTSKFGNNCRVDIGASEQATLSLFAFPNATKRNKGIVEIGDIIFAKVMAAAKDVETELVCVDQHGRKDGLGVLPKGGYMIKVPINISRRLLAPDSRISEFLGQKYRFEKAIGMNGRIWIRARSFETTILISNFIKQLEYIPNSELMETCNLLCK